MRAVPVTRMAPAFGKCLLVVLTVCAISVVILRSCAVRGTCAMSVASAARMACATFVVTLRILAARGLRAKRGTSVDQMISATDVVGMVNLAAKGIHVEWIGLSVVQMSFAMSVEGMMSPVVMAIFAQKVISAVWMGNALHVEDITKFVVMG